MKATQKTEKQNTKNENSSQDAHSYHVKNRLFYSQANTPFPETAEISVKSFGTTKATNRPTTTFHQTLDIRLAHGYISANLASHVLHSAAKCNTQNP